MVPAQIYNMHVQLYLHVLVAGRRTKFAVLMARGAGGLGRMQLSVICQNACKPIHTTK
eukprot:COSAG05_NODE_1119_length_5816_cov_7.262375_7_plen_58_part_00